MRKLFLLFLPVIFTACSGGYDHAPAPASDSAAYGPDSTSDWHELTESWTASLNLKNAPIMKSFYADSVFYYGDMISAADVVSRQTAYFSEHPDYHQKIVEYTGEEQQPDGSWRVRITKEVKAGGKTANYPASLIFAKQQNGIWKIVAESDDITDINKARAQQLGYETEVTIDGLLEETSGYLPAPDGNTKSNKEDYFILWPASRLDVNPSPDQQKDYPAERNVDRLQVKGDANTLRPLLNKKVRITGTLSHQQTPHDFTKVILTVRSVEAEK